MRPLRHHGVVIDQEPSDVGMRLDEVRAVLADLSQEGCRFWVAGGWESMRSSVAKRVRTAT